MRLLPYKAVQYVLEKEKGGKGRVTCVREEKKRTSRSGMSWKQERIESREGTLKENISAAELALREVALRATGHKMEVTVAAAW